MSSMRGLFRFEDDLREKLPCVPMAVRYKLDVAGIKLQLKEWLRLTPEERQEFLEWPWDGAEDARAFRDHLIVCVRERTGSTPEFMPFPASFPWNAEDVPPAVAAKAQAEDVSIGTDAWNRLEVLQRFALIKLSRPRHENRNFLAAAKEFGLAR
jgi:hypothetical protein